MQQDDINKMDMNDLRSFMVEGFEATNDHIDNLEINTNAKFAKVDAQFVKVYEKFDEQKSYMDEGFEMTNKHIDNVEIGLGNKIADLETSMSTQFQKVNEKIEVLSDLVVKIADKIL